MNTTSEILSSKSHRDYDYPKHNWMYYQEWSRVLFLHYQVSVDTLLELIPKDLTIDTFEGMAYISIVPFTMENIRPRFLPSLAFVSNFGEINVRTYVIKDGRRGVYFLNIEAEKYLSALLAKKLSGLPYEKSNIKISGTKYDSKNLNKGFSLKTEYNIGKKIVNKTALDLWLTERYCLYVDNKESLFRFEIHHEEWNLNNVELKKLELNYEIGKLKITESTDLVHYSKGVKVLAWNKVKLK
jgi:uncharacterized protein